MNSTSFTGRQKTTLKIGGVGLLLDERYTNLKVDKQNIFWLPMKQVAGMLLGPQVQYISQRKLVLLIKPWAQADNQASQGSAVTITLQRCDPNGQAFQRVHTGPPLNPFSATLSRLIDRPVGESII